MNLNIDDHRQILSEACTLAGIDPDGAEPIRIDENAIFRLPGRVVVRIARPGQLAAATREVQVARRLARHEPLASRLVLVTWADWRSCYLGQTTDVGQD